MNDQQQSRADALTDDQRQALGEAISEYFEKLDSDEGIRTPEGRILRAFDYCDSRNVDDLIDRAILPALATSANETGAEGATWHAGVEAVAKMIEKKAADYLAEYGYVEHDTGAVSWGLGNHADEKRDYHWSLVELAEEVRAMAPAMAAAAPAEEMIRFCPECGRLGDIPAGYEACCPDWSQARIVPKRFAELCAETFRLCVSQPLPQSGTASADERAAFEAAEREYGYDRDTDIARRAFADGWQARAAASPAASVVSLTDNQREVIEFAANTMDERMLDAHARVLRALLNGADQ
ncbi:hypothetical protein LGN03_08990 [Burkholderia multivorans]|nr:hypothetical protein [Burkholderia multivorans]